MEWISGLIYEESRGVLKQFLEAIIKDAILFTQYNNRRTVTPIDIVFALKQHGQNVYGFTRPYSFSVKKKGHPSTIKTKGKEMNNVCELGSVLTRITVSDSDLRS